MPRVATPWREAFGKEYSVHEQFGTFEYVDANSVPRGALIPKAVIRFSYEYDKGGKVVSHKARFEYLGHRLTPGVHCNPHTLSTSVIGYSLYAADRDTICLLLTLAVERGLDLNHVDLVSVFI